MQGGRNTPARQMLTVEEVLALLVSQPHLSLRELSAHTGLSVPTLSRITNSDAFRARLAEMQKANTAYLATTIAAKARAAFSVAVEKLTERLEITTDVPTLTTAVKTLAEIAEPKVVQAQQQNNVFMVDQGSLAEIRQKMVEAATAPVKQAESQTTSVDEGVTVIEGEVVREEKGDDPCGIC